MISNSNSTANSQSTASELQKLRNEASSANAAAQFWQQQLANIKAGKQWTALQGWIIKANQLPAATTAERFSRRNSSAVCKSSAGTEKPNTTIDSTTYKLTLRDKWKSFKLLAQVFLV